MKIKIIFVIIAVIFAAVGATTGAWITNKSAQKNAAAIVKVYQEQNKETLSRYQEIRGDYKELAGKARYLIEQKLYNRKVKNGIVTFDPASTMDINKIIDKVEEKINMSMDTLELDTIIVEKSWLYNLFHN